MTAQLMIARVLSTTLVSYALVPIGVMAVSWVAQSSFSMRPNAAADIFAFTLSLDLVMLIQRASLLPRINPLFDRTYGQVFGLALLFSVGFLIYASKVQSLIYSRRQGSYYPYVRVAVCWAAGIAVIGFHLYALLGA